MSDRPSAFMTAALVLTGSAGILYLALHRDAPAPVAEPVAPSSAPQGPACVHEVCAERPTSLRCVEVDKEWHICARYEIERGHHCDCYRWESADERGMRDGGAP